MEMRAVRMFMVGRKKRYAYLEMWEEGMDFADHINGGEGNFKVTGFDCVRSNTAQITKEVQRDILETIVRGGSKSEVAEMMFDAARSIDATDPHWEYLGIPQGLGKKIHPAKSDSDDYYNWSTTGDHPQDAHPRGVWFANHLLDVDYGKGSKPYRAYTKPSLTVEEEEVDVICYEYDHDLDPVDGELRMDVSVMQEKVLEQPTERILRAFDLELDAAIRGDAQSQAVLGAFM